MNTFNILSLLIHEHVTIYLGLLSSLKFFFLRFFWCGPFLKSLQNFLQWCFYFMFWFLWPWGMWDLGSLTRDQTHAPCIERWSFNHWVTRDVLHPFSLLLQIFCKHSTYLFEELFLASLCFFAFIKRAIALIGYCWLVATPSISVSSILAELFY